VEVARRGARLVCRWGVRSFAVAYVAALAIHLVGDFGLFAQPRDPLAGAFLIPLGLPWNLAVDRAPEPLWPWLAAAAPALDLLLLAGVCRSAEGRLRRPAARDG
jgi:hypothetical protein